MSQTEKELIARCQAGDLAAFEPLVEQYRARVWRVAYQLLRNREDALDVAQEAFVRAYQSLPHFRGESAFYTWLFRIVVNLATDYRRQRATRARTLDPGVVEAEESTRTVADSGLPPDLEASRAQERERISEALESLPPHHRTVIILSDIEGMPYREIAEVLRCPIGTVMSRLHNARKRLRTLLGPLLALLLALWLGGLPAWAQAPSVSVIARILWASKAPPGSAPPVGGPTVVPGSRQQDEAFRLQVDRLRQVLGYQSYKPLDVIEARVPLGTAHRVVLPGGRHLELRPAAVERAVVRMDVKIMNRGVTEVSVVADLSPDHATVLGGPPYGGGVLIIAITAETN